MYSNLALKLYTLVKNGIIKSNTDFWKNYNSTLIVDSYNLDLTNCEKGLKDKNLSLVCAFDNDFPSISTSIKNSEKPFLFAYKGDVSLLKSENNIAVIGTLKIDSDTQDREKVIVKQLVDTKYNIVSGLAKGCDTVAHKECLKNNGKTVAILPTTFDSIYPKENTKLVDEIIENGGLAITEYICEPKNHFEQTKRFIERDRLQAMFSKAVVLIASFRKGEGDSGSRYAIEKANVYNKKVFIMYDEIKDKNNLIFGLNTDLFLQGAKIFNIKEL